MDDAISRDNVFKFLNRMEESVAGDDLISKTAMATIECARNYIAAIPSIDAVPVVHGEWIEYGEPNSQGEYELWYWTCSKCSAVGLGTFNYCPECGARMDGDNK